MCAILEIESKLCICLNCLLYIMYFFIFYFLIFRAFLISGIQSVLLYTNWFWRVNLVLVKLPCLWCSNFFCDASFRWIPPSLPSIKSPEHEKETSTTFAAGRSRVSVLFKKEKLNILRYLIAWNSHVVPMLDISTMGMRLMLDVALLCLESLYWKMK